VVALILATVPDVTFAADPPGFDVPTTPPFGATLAVVAGQPLEFPVQASDPDLPTDVVTQITADGLHTCALLDTGNIRCWGSTGDGQLSYGTHISFSRSKPPASVGDVPVGGTVVQVAGGNSHTCALLDTGTVRCWGRGDRGQLGYGNTDHIGLNDTPASAADVDVGARIRSATLMVSSTDTMTRCAMSSAVNSISAM